MARPLRIEFPGAFYHITARGNERKPIYRNDRDRVLFLKILAEVADRFRLLVHSYVLMDNHYHLLVETLEANLGRALHRLNARHAQTFNWTHRRVGHLFQGRYKSLLVDRDAYLLELSRYIHLNPVRAGMVEHADQYRWSSAGAYVGKHPAPPFLTIADVLGHFGCSERRAAKRYAQFLLHGETHLDATSPLNNVIGQTLLGSPDWIREILARLEVDGAPDLATEVPAVRKLQPRPTLGEVVARVAAVMKTDAIEICRAGSRAPARAVAMHLAILSGLPQRDIGIEFGVGRFAVSKAAVRGSRIISNDRRLRRLEHNLCPNKHT
jgi:REP element-mobilizing transposase RayT